MTSLKKFLALSAILLSVTACAMFDDNRGTVASNDEQTTAESVPTPSTEKQLAAQEVVDRSETTVQTLASEKDFPGIRDLIGKAKGVMVFPKLVKAGFLIGGEGGVGTLLIRQEDGSWSNPAFYNMVGGSFGLQIGVESSETMFLIMTQKGLDSILKNQVKLGADVSVALGPVGAGIGASKTAVDLASDIYAYSKSSGLYGGGAFKGAVITVRDDLNHAYYEETATAQSILQNTGYPASGADGLRAALALEPVLNNKAVPLTPVHQY